MQATGLTPGQYGEVSAPAASSMTVVTEEVAALGRPSPVTSDTNELCATTTVATNHHGSRGSS